VSTESPGPGPSWARFAAGERRGALSFVDAAKVLAAVATVRSGEVFSLNAPLDLPPPAITGRPSLRRSMRLHNHERPLSGGRHAVINDDNVELALQGSSHWDSFAHFGVREPGGDAVFFGGAGLGETSPEPRAKTLGIDAFAGGIVTRGVVLDLVGTLQPPGTPYLPAGPTVSRDDVERCLEAEGVTLERGDAVLLFTGYEQRVADDAVGEHVPGIDGTTLPLWVEAEVAALAADNPAVEALPIDSAIHVGALRDAGILLGELWALEPLVRRCREDGRYECLLASAPLNIPGAFGSPANALAIR
jgi:kynurenine formamidase